MASLGGSLHQEGRPSSACSQTSLDTAASGAVSASSASGRVGHTSPLIFVPADLAPFELLLTKPWHGTYILILCTVQV